MDFAEEKDCYSRYSIKTGYVLQITYVVEGTVFQAVKKVPPDSGVIRRGDEIHIMYDPRNPKHCYIL